MGRAAAEDAAHFMPLGLALEWHLTSNHYPPIHPDFHPVAREALELAVGEEWDNTLTLPNEVEKTVAEVIEELHLDEFIPAMRAELEDDE